MPLVCFAAPNSPYHNRLLVSIESIETSKVCSCRRCVELREVCVSLGFTAASTCPSAHRPYTFTHFMQAGSTLSVDVLWINFMQRAETETYQESVFVQSLCLMVNDDCTLLRVLWHIDSCCACCCCCCCCCWLILLLIVLLLLLLLLLLMLLLLLLLSSLLHPYKLYFPCSDGRDSEASYLLSESLTLTIWIPQPLGSTGTEISNSRDLEESIRYDD